MFGLFKWKNPGQSALVAAFENKPRIINWIEQSLASYENGLPEYFTEQRAKVRVAREFLHHGLGKDVSLDTLATERKALADDSWAGLATLLQFSDCLSRGKNGDKDAEEQARKIFSENFQVLERVAEHPRSFDTYAGMRTWAADSAISPAIPHSHFRPVPNFPIS